MTILGRSIVKSVGYIGSPGYNIIHWSAGTGTGPTDPDGVDEFHSTLYTAYSNLDEFLVTGADWTIESQVVYFDDSDGVLLGSTTDPGGARTWDGADSAKQVDRSLCATLRLRTDDYVAGRRLQGRIFIGPIGASTIGTDGQVGLGAAATIASEFSGLISGLGGRLAVWHRPTTPSGTDGAYGDVTSLICNSTPGTLRSRKI